MPTRQRGRGVGVVLEGILLLWAIEAVDILLTLLLTGGHPTGQRMWWQGGVLDALLGLRPREWWGLVGVPCAPFLHDGSLHLAANSLALLVLGMLSVAYSPGLTGRAIAAAMLIGGLFTWVIGRPGTVHVGASGVLFGLIGFLIVNALVRKGCLPWLIAIPVAVLYGGAIPAMLPGMAGMHISWEMHLGGFIGGVLASLGASDERR